ncbi:MAG TPA: O-antigen ligase family protein [Burkholderiales bacterium]
MAALLQGSIFRWGAIALLATSVLAAPRRALAADGLGIALGLFCGWLFLSAVFLTPSYSAEALYRPLVLFGGYAAGVSLGRPALTQLFRAGTALLALLVLLGLLQLYFGFWHLAHNPQRAAATFITPNTFATAINLILLPLAVLALVRGRSRWAYALALWLFAGLLATESRGGWLAAFAGLVFIAWYQGVPRTREAREPWMRLMAGLLWVYIAFWVLLRLLPLIPIPGLALGTGLAESFGETVVSRGTSYRIDIAMVALGRIAERPLAGAGASMFSNLMEMTKPAELDIGQTFRFVHNDYLQIWVEFGLIGLVLLGAVIGSAFVSLLRSRRVDRADSLPIACGAALTSALAHAAVDFPLYIPFLLLLVGLWLGALSAHGSHPGRLEPLLATIGRRLAPLRTRLVGGALAVAALAWLAQPAAADFATSEALTELRAGRPDSGLYWQSVARRLEPRNGVHYWTEAVIWRDQAVEARSKAFAARADMLFAEGMRADPYQVANYIERARMHRTHAELFDQPAGPRQLLAWTGEALRLRPFSLVAQAEHARTLAYAGQTEEALRIVRAMLERHGDTGMARGLAKEFGLREPVETTR